MNRFYKSIVCRLMALAAALHFAIAPALAASQCGCGTCECAAESMQSCCCGKPVEQKASGKSCCGHHASSAQRTTPSHQKLCCQPSPASCETAQNCSCQPTSAAEQSAVPSRAVIKKVQNAAPLVFAAYADDHRRGDALNALPAAGRPAPPAVARHVLLCVWRN
jgi:hypothetical protein